MEKVQDVLDKSNFNRYGFVSKEFVEQSLNKMLQIDETKESLMPEVDVRKKKEGTLELKDRKRKKKEKRRSVLEEEAGLIIDMKG